MDEPISEAKAEDAKTTFKTKDLNMAAFLWCIDGARLLCMDGERGRDGKSKTVYFSFEVPMQDEAFHQLQIDYANGDTVVEPTGFCKRQNQLRDLLHDILSMKRSIA